MAGKPQFPEILSFGDQGYGDELAWATLVSLAIALLAYAIGLTIGMIGALCKLRGSLLTRVVLDGYTTLVRAVPELILIVLLFYAGTTALNALLGWLALGSVAISGFVAAVAVLGFVQGAFATEVFRSAIQAIPLGQIEAARAFGMSPWLELKRVIIPALLPLALPGLSNLWLICTKGTALIAVVGYTELTLATFQAAGNTKFYATFYLVAGAIYLVITLISNRLFAWLEAQVRRGQRLGV